MTHIADPPLAGLSLLLVRPQRDNDTFAQLVTERGARVFSLPVMAIKPLIPDADTLRNLAAIGRYQKVVVVSGNAASLALQHIHKPASLPSVPAWYAVGESTANTLIAGGIPAACPAENPTSEGLLALPDFARVEGEHILIIRGVGGRDKLRSELEQRGAVVTFCELYRRESETAHQSAINRLLEAGEVQVVVAHSVDVLRNFLAQLDRNRLSSNPALAVLVPSQAAANLAQEAGFATVILAQSALPASMVEALVGWYTASQ